MTFADRADDRNNNFNLMRLVAAFLVLLNHSALLLNILPVWEPYAYGYSFSSANFGVNVFFVISGFLVTRSLFGRRDLIIFIWARVLRIFPGLWAMLLVTVFGLGLMMTKLSTFDYLTSPKTNEYMLRCATMVFGLRWYLPGVFEGNKFDTMFNRSLWTLPLEWRLYEYLALAYFIFYSLKTSTLSSFRILVPIGAACAFGAASFSSVMQNKIDFGAVNTYMFLAGSAVYLYRERILISIKLLSVLTLLLIISTLNKDALSITYLAALPMVILTIAYTQSKILLSFNNCGDYSYGVYIYAFPIQQTVIAIRPGVSLVGLTFFASVATLAVAVLSWKLVEKPALSQKEAMAEATSRAFGAICSRVSLKAP